MSDYKVGYNQGVSDCRLRLEIAMKLLNLPDKNDLVRDLTQEVFKLVDELMGCLVKEKSK